MIRMLKRATVIQGIAVTKCLIKRSQITAKNSGNIPPHTISTGHDFPISAMYLCPYEHNLFFTLFYFTNNLYQKILIKKKSNSSNLQNRWLRIDGAVNRFVDENVFLDMNAAHLLPHPHRHVRRTSDELAAPINWRKRKKEKTQKQFGQLWYHITIASSCFSFSNTVYAREYDRVTRTQKLERVVPHVGSEKLEVVVVSVDPIVHGETNIGFRVIADPTYGIIWGHRTVH